MIVVPFVNLCLIAKLMNLVMLNNKQKRMKDSLGRIFEKRILVQLVIVQIHLLQMIEILALHKHNF